MITRPPFDATDPRLNMPAETLSDAQHNGYPIVASQLARKDRAGLALGIGIASLLGAIAFVVMASNRARPVVTPPPSVATTAPIVTAITPPPPVPAAVTPLPVVPAALPKALPPPGPLPVAVNPNAQVERARAPALVFDNSPSLPVAGTGSAVGATPAAAKPAQQGLTPEEVFAQRLTGEGGTATATHMTSPSSTIAEGTLMSAVLETAIDTDVPGYVRAIISRDVRSFDGTQVLIPRSSHVIGQYKSGLAVGQTRAYILWTRLIRPDGVSIALASPATDSSGRNGLGGKVDSHFGKRFGSAILLSVIGAAGQALGSGGTSVILAAPQAAVSSTAQSNLTIPPTIRVAQGQAIRIFTAHDLDFSSVSDGK